MSFQEDGSMDVCNYLKGDPFSERLCQDTMKGFLPMELLKRPVVGTLVLQAEAGTDIRWKNQTIPNLYNDQGSTESKLWECIREKDPKCYCGIHNAFVPPQLFLGPR